MTQYTCTCRVPKVVATDRLIGVRNTNGVDELEVPGLPCIDLVVFKHACQAGGVGRCTRIRTHAALGLQYCMLHICTHAPARLKLGCRNH